MSDLISRKHLLNWLRNYQFENFAEVGHEKEYNFIENLIKGIENEPTVEAKPVVHGEWKVYDEEYEAWECSICGKVWCLYGTPIDNGMNFCPKCGADMRGEKHD